MLCNRKKGLLFLPLSLSATTCYAMRARMSLLKYAQCFGEAGTEILQLDEVFYLDFVNKALGANTELLRFAKF